MTARIKNRATSQCLLATALLITMGHTTADYVVQVLPGVVNSEQHTVDCEEIAPLCDVEYKRRNKTDHFLFSVPVHDSGLSATAVLVIINANSQTPCTVDPLKDVGDIINGITEIIELVMFVSCSEDTRVILRPGINVTSPSIMVTLVIEKCTVYWKDLQKLSNYSGIDDLILVDWKDEFETNASGYFNDCVNLTRSEGSTINQTLNSSKPIFYIDGLSHVVWVEVISNTLKTVSPAFTHYQWPSVAEINFKG